MKEDLQKFLDLVKTDEALQKKLEEAVSGYDGEQTEEAVFEAIIIPAAKEAGFSFTMDEYKQSVQELDLNEMAQVSGGGGYGACFAGCAIIGVGLGGAGGKDDNMKSYGGTACAAVGLGWGATSCALTGEVKGLELPF